MSIFSRNNRDDKAVYSFGQVIKGFQYAVNSAQEMLSAQHLDMLSRYFHENGTAKTKTVKLSSGKEADVPLLALVPHNALAIDEMEIKFTTQIKDVENESIESDVHSTVPHISMNMEMTSAPADGNSPVQVTIRFKAIPQPESVSRIIDEQSKLL